MPQSIYTFINTTILRKRILSATVVLTMLWGCESDRKFPEVRNLNAYNRTSFLPTLEHNLPANVNSVYCATLLFAWDELKDTLNSPVNVDKALTDLHLLNSSKSYLNTLKTDEYFSETNIEGDLISVRAEFDKSLPFAWELQSFEENGLTFDNENVAAFGSYAFDYRVSEIIQILYYKNDNNFIIKLQPRDKEHEIILYKTNTKFNSMAEIVKDMENKLVRGRKERDNPDSNWKYVLVAGDEVVIPKIEFNIESNYLNLEGNKFQSNNTTFEIGTAWQRTAFILDEKGAEIQSKSRSSSLKDEESEPEEPRPKLMLFNKPFFLMLRRANTRNPYFGLWIYNTELMRKLNN